MFIFVFGFIIHFLSDQKLLPAGMKIGAEMTEKEAVLNLPEPACKMNASRSRLPSHLSCYGIYK